ncbi:MAG: pyrimidine/purine nucleoside phosphorylase [Gammaproteobacteria bacterium]
MSEFTNVTAIREANIYFDGKVTSRTVVFPDGTRKTLGIMMPGEYTFDTGSAEIMEVLQGALTVQLPDSSEWRTFTAGEQFEIPANATFSLKVEQVSDYCCSYLETGS